MYISSFSILSNIMAGTIDLDDYSVSESEFGPEGNAGSANNDIDTDNSNDSESAH